MLTIILRRLAISIPLLLVVSAITYVLQSFVPGDPVRALLGINATPEQYAAVREALHLDDPVLVQYGRYLLDVVHGDLGVSIFTNQPVIDSIAQRLPITLALLLGAAVVSTLVGVVLGVISATGGRIVRRTVDVISLLGNALPNFWVGLILVAVFAVGLGLFPATGWVSFDRSPSLWLSSLTLPVVALALGGVALIAKVTRDGMLTALDQNFIRTLRASGASENSIVWRHALRNSGTGIVTVIGLSLISFIPGTILIENVFVLPGLGTLTVSATNQHDIVVVQGVALTFTLIVIIANLAVDIAYGVLNPKVKAAR
jgi:peptide/nickel transport system permease protein